MKRRKENNIIKSQEIQKGQGDKCGILRRESISLGIMIAWSISLQLANALITWNS